MLHQGIRWRVGAGHSVKVWADPWLPGEYPFRLHGPMRQDSNELRAVNLLDMATGSWNEASLQLLFALADIARIRSIQLRTDQQPDILMWHHEASGEYSVKSGYHLLQNLNNENVGLAEKKLWTTI